MSLAGKKVLIVYAHQSSGSFNAAAKDAAVEVLTAKGCTVKVSDLYAIKFKATATTEDIQGEVKNAEHFRYADETKDAWESGKLAVDITEEQCKLSEANLIIFQFPMYWFSMPAILKGWIDRVLTLGYAYSDEKRYGQGIFKEKKAILSFTTGSTESMFSANGINGDMNVTLWPIQNGILHYCGFNVLAPQIFWAPSTLPREASNALLQAWRNRLEGLLDEAALTFTPMDYFDGEAGFRLKPEVQQKQSSEKFGLTVGTHMGMAVPPNNMMRSGV
ncbi:ribosyldihydronicotinamide dehydrogenase [quinone]-like [Corythoichthys intestinalis]|uniref:ribosyldihydronicotinamide dehydrogenase [quinone]-like n=1 Tax=Corythoichthys intestinalis TaxID=161448 RepID=UPI0025A6089C|nr:ribosyldihydronicotinamide dehydrogenase [quinone]-like [Corythoichthys intestinalis]